MSKFAVFHAMKGKGTGGQLGRHIDRMHQVANADPDRTHLNRHVVMNGEGRAQILSQAEFHQRRESGQIKDMYAGVSDRIKARYQGKTAIRKDAVRYVNLMLSGSPEQMKQIEQAGKLEDWMKSNYRFVREEFGQENIIRFAMHADEKTPHIHATVVPLTADGRLSAKEYLFGHKEKLRGFQDRYAKAMEPFGLERGLEGRKTRHQTTAEYYRRQEYATKIALPEIKPLERRRGLLGLQGKEEYYEVDKRALDGFILAQKGQEEVLTQRDKENEQLRQYIGKQDKEINTAHELLRHVGQGNQQVIATLQQAARDIQEKEKRKTAFFQRYPHMSEEQFDRYEKLREQQEQRNQREQNQPGHRRGQDRGGPSLS